MDDVFVTGMLAEKANVSHRDISDLITFYEDWDEEVLWVAVHLFEPVAGSPYWQRLVRPCAAGQ